MCGGKGTPTWEYEEKANQPPVRINALIMRLRMITTQRERESKWRKEREQHEYGVCACAEILLIVT